MNISYFIWEYIDRKAVTEVIGAYIIQPLLTKTTQMHTGPMEATT
jgi:hypothetical protein